MHIAQVQIFPISVKSQHGSSAEADPGNRAGSFQTGGHGGTPEATGEQYRPAVGARRAPEFSLQGPIEIGALRGKSQNLVISRRETRNSAIPSK